MDSDHPGTNRMKRRHHKSRTGCTNCKQRRVKCDEARPKCERCTWRDDPCVYPSANVADAVIEEKATIVPRPDIDAKLVQHFLSHTCHTYARTLDDEPEQAALWTSALPAVAFKVKAASHALMALSAFCLDSHSPSEELGDSVDYRASAELHYQQALVLVRPMIKNIEAASIGDVLATIMMLGACGVAHMRGRSDLSAVSEWLHHVRAFRAVKVVLHSLLHADCGSLRPVLRSAIPFDPREWSRLSDSDREGATGLLRIIRETRSSALQLVRTAMDAQPRYSDTVMLAYNQALTLLQTVCTYLLDYRPWNRFRTVWHWPATISTEFVDLLIGGDNMALVIYAHWLACVLLLRNRWWVADMGANGIKMVASTIDPTDVRLDGLLTWPLKMVQQSLDDQKAGLFAIGSLDLMQ
ncbi:hypothetical protein LTR22_018935 [Elasticomyces elasticus]|nr:hypothetical protein LTR22_018935 [Elasticomyces elasticus]